MNSFNKTFLPTQNYKNRNWFILDCKGQKLGRLATIIAGILKGKMKPHYFPSFDIGDYVILINAESIIIHEEMKQYIVNHPGRPGYALRIQKISDLLPKLIIERAVKGMLGESEKKRFIKRLKIFNHRNHAHKAQNPIQLDVSKFDLNSEISMVK